MNSNLIDCYLDTPPKMLSIGVQNFLLSKAADKSLCRVVSQWWNNYVRVRIYRKHENKQLLKKPIKLSIMLYGSAHQLKFST